MLNFLFTQTPLVYFYQSLWRDEAFSYFLTTKKIGELLVLTAKDFNPPLYYLWLKVWIAIFGKSEIALRSLSLIFFWLTVYIGYLFLTQVFKFSWKKSYLYLMLFIINPVLNYYAFEARMYSMFAFLVSLSFYALITKKNYLYIISTVLGLYTHYFMLIVLGGQLLFNYLINRKKRQLFFQNQLICLFAFIPWLMFILKLKDWQTINHFWILKTSLPSWLNFIGFIYTGYEKNFLFFSKNITYLAIAIFLIIFFAFIKNRLYYRQKNKLELLLLIWAIIIPFLVLMYSYIKPIFLTRYLIFTSVGLILLLIYSLEQFNLILKILIIIPLVLITLNYQKWQIKHRQKTNFRQLYLQIAPLAKKDDLIYVTNELDYFTAQYYFGEKKVFIYGKTYEEIPAFVGKVLIQKENIITHLPHYPQKAFVINADYSYSINANF
jgi:uncharacterized membrane protein